MSDYCNCCTTNGEYIRQHYDPDAQTRHDECPEDVLEIFRACSDPDLSCPLTLRDVERYLEELALEARTTPRSAGRRYW
jgi:hypothetical protein